MRLIVITFITLFGIGCSGYKIEIKEFQPNRITVNTSKPVYYSNKQGLYYSENGNIFSSNNTLVWKKGHGEVFVSPDSNYIVLTHDNALYVIDKSGLIIDLISPARYPRFDSVIKRALIVGTQFYHSDSIQWSRDSSGFYLIKDTVNENGRQYWSKKSSLFYYNIKNKRFNCAIKYFPTSDYFASYNKKRIYYRVASKGDVFIMVHDLGENISRKLTELELENLNKSPKESIFINFRKYGYYHHDSVQYISDNMQSKVVFEKNCRNDFLGGLWLYQDGEFTHLLKAKDGLHSSIVKYYYNLRLSGAYFLPGGRYLFVPRIASKEFEGNLIIDTEKSSYVVIDEPFWAFFSITSEDVVNFSISMWKTIRKPNRLIDRSTLNQIKSFAYNKSCKNN